VRSTFLSSGLFNPDQLPGDVPYCTGPACVRGDDGRLLSAPESGPESATEAARLHTYLMTLDSSLPETEWAAPRIRTYVAPRIQVCLGTYLNLPDRAVPVPSDLSILLPAFPTRAAELLSDREPSGPSGPAPCFEVTLEDARTLADEFLSPAGRGSHEYSGIVIRNPQLDAIPPVGIVAYINFQPLLPDGSPASFGG
jgi:hypothetical protein